MTGRERRARDPLWLAKVRARLARMRVARAARVTEEVRERWERENVIEAVYLGRHDDERRRDARRDDG